MTRPMRKSCWRSITGEYLPLIDKAGSTYADEFIQEDTAEAAAGRNIQRENTSRPVGREQDCLEFAGRLESLCDFLQPVSQRYSLVR